MTDTPTPEAVEPMTDSDLTEIESLLVNRSLSDVVTVSVNRVERLLARVVAAESRALPAPRRYTGGPLEDGLYLWRWPEVRRGPFVTMTVEDGELDLGRPRLVFGDWVWLIGPIPIPDLPEEEATNG